MIESNRKVVGFTAGNFDLLHPGYIYTFEKAKEHCDYVDEVQTYQTEEELEGLINFYQPDIRILGDDYIGKPFTGDHLPPKVVYTTRAHNWSTTRIKNLITIQTLRQNPEIINEVKKLEDEN